MGRIPLAMFCVLSVGCSDVRDSRIDCGPPANVSKEMAEQVRTLQGSIPMFAVDGQLSRRVALAELNSDGYLALPETNEVFAAPVRNEAGEIFAMREINCENESLSAGEIAGEIALDTVGFVIAVLGGG